LLNGEPPDIHPKVVFPNWVESTYCCWLKMKLASEDERKKKPTKIPRRHHANEQQRIHHHVPIIRDLQPVSFL